MNIQNVIHNVKIGNDAAVNGQYASLQFKLNSGDNWETQNSAFTEALKAKLVAYRSFNNNTGKLEFTTNSLWWVGQVYNVINFAPSTLYQPTAYAAKQNAGEWIYAFVSGGSALFGSNGAYLLDDKPVLTLVFEMDFTSGFSAVQILNSKNYC